MSGPDLSRRDLLLGSAFVAAAGLGVAGSLLNQPRALGAGGLDPLIPAEIAGWRSAGTGGVIAAEEGDLSRSVYDEVLTRLYLADDRPPIMLLIAYGGNQSGNMQLHRPEACYPAAGFALGEAQDVTVEALPGRAIPARLIQAVAPSRTEQILYWTRIGDDFPRSRSAQRWAVVRDNLRGEVPDGVLVRVSTIGQSLPGSLPVLTRFIRALAGSAPTPGRALLTGRA